MALAPIDRFLDLLPELQDLPDKSLWLQYDQEADVLYVNFLKPGSAEDSELTDNDMIIRYDDQGKIIGYTILHAQQR